MIDPSAFQWPDKLDVDVAFDLLVNQHKCYIISVKHHWIIFEASDTPEDAVFRAFRKLAELTHPKKP